MSREKWSTYRGYVDVGPVVVVTTAEGDGLRSGMKWKIRE